MKRILGLLLALAGCLAAIPAYAQERTTVKFNDPSRPGLLKIDWHNGSIIVKTHNSSDVTLDTARNVNRRPDPPEAAGLRRIDTAGQITVDSDSSNVITISSHNGQNGGNLEIEVPVKTNLNLQSHNGAIISVDGVEGDIEVSNYNGTINVLNVAGSVVADSHNGKVTVSLRDISPGKPMSFSSMNGSVDVTLPPTSKLNVKLRTQNGGIWTDFDIQTQPGSALTGPGDKTITGTINGGGADFDLRTHNGNIYLKKEK
jgi:DUF4097 and DUF4098 domain-containing protein YvlB